MGRYIEFILGLIGGILGFIASAIALAVGGVSIIFGAYYVGHLVTILGLLGMFFSLFAIIAVFLVIRWAKLSGILMIISAIGGLICVNVFFILPFILLMIAGIMALFRRTKFEKENILIKEKEKEAKVAKAKRSKKAKVTKAKKSKKTKPSKVKKSKTNKK